MSVIRLLLIYSFVISSVYGDEGGFIVYKADFTSYKVSPFSIHPPSGGENHPEASLLQIISVGSELLRFQMEKDSLNKAFEVARTNDASNDPPFARGVSYLIADPEGKFFLIYRENDKNLKENTLNRRFLITHLVRIKTKELLFVEGEKLGGTSYDKKLIEILKGID